MQSIYIFCAICAFFLAANCRSVTLKDLKDPIEVTDQFLDFYSVLYNELIRIKRGLVGNNKCPERYRRCGIVCIACVM